MEHRSPHQLEPHRHHRLLLVRPGDAVGKRSWPGPAETRPLSDKGRKHATRLARFLSSQAVDVTTVVAGHETRERETGEIIGRWLGCRVLADARITPALTPERLETLLDDVTAGSHQAPHQQRTLLVAREPVASLLLVTLTDSPGVDLAEAGAASLRLHGPLAPGSASLGWLVVPSMLRGSKGKGARRGRETAADDRELVTS